MKITRNEIEVQHMPSFKGGEKELSARMFYDGNVRILSDAVLVPGASIGLHAHEGSMEIIYILEGAGVCICEGKEEILEPGDVHYCKEGEAHTLMNKGEKDLRFFAVVPNVKKAA